MVAQVSRGTVQEGIIIKSKILDRDVRYTVYLPFDYNTSSRYYPVTYLLHGYTDDDTGWLQFGEANLIADEAIAKREIPPMIIVMPDGDVSFYMNNHDGTERYEDFFFEEFIPHVESEYRIRKEKRFRGIAGLSMGGYGALLYSFKHPDMFAACAAYSAAVRINEDLLNEKGWGPLWEKLYGKQPKDESEISQHILDNSPIYIAQNTDIEKLKKVRIYMDCGDDDFLYRGNSTLHIVLRDLEIPHEYRVRNGGHQWSYWRSGLVDGLKFIGVSFHQQ